LLGLFVGCLDTSEWISGGMGRTIIPNTLTSFLLGVLGVELIFKEKGEITMANSP
jgi:hypothetical protein